SVVCTGHAVPRKCEAQRRPFGPPDELQVQGLGSESIWSVLELRNVPLEKHTNKTLTRLLQSEDVWRVSSRQGKGMEGDAKDTSKREAQLRP
ncbi:unnamed protein product, partial [Ectocarpus fasciculatus]